MNILINYKEIKVARNLLGYSQTEVALMTGVSLAGFRLWESGGTKPTEENEAKLRKALKIGE